MTQNGQMQRCFTNVKMFKDQKNVVYVSILQERKCQDQRKQGSAIKSTVYNTENKFKLCVWKGYVGRNVRWEKEES